MKLSRFLRFRHYQLVTLEPADIPDRFRTIPEGLAARFLSPEECRALARSRRGDLRTPMVEIALRKGDRCMGILDGDQLASYTWYSQSVTRIPGGFGVAFDEAWVYMYQGFTFPEYRGRRLHAYAMTAAVMSYHREGRMGLVSLVERSNVASLRSALRPGSRVVGRVATVKVLRFRWAARTRSCRRYRIRMTKSK